MTKKIAPKIKGTFDAFLPEAQVLDDNKSGHPKHPGGRPRHREKLGPTEKATFRIPSHSVQLLEKTYLKIRSESGPKITKSALVGLAIDQVLPRVQKGELLKELEDYLG